MPVKKSDVSLVKIDAHRIGDSIVYIENMVVPSHLRRRGLGRRAYEAWEKKLPKTVKLIRLHAADEGYGSSDRFWEAMGFEYRYNFESDPGPDDYEASHEMHKGVNSGKTPKAILVENEGEND